MITPKEIYTALSTNDELTQLLKKVDEITVISYDGTDATWCDALAEYLQKIDKDIECVKKIILFGLGGVKDTWKEIVGKEFPSAEIVSYSEAWNKVNPLNIHVDTPLVVHFTYAIGDYKSDFLNSTDRGKPLKRMVFLTRLLFSAVVLGAKQSLEIVTRSTLPGKINSVINAERSSYCIEKENYINQCKKELSHNNALLVCLEEVKHGCVSCCMVKNYGKIRHCPLAQHEVAQLYCEQNHQDAFRLAHQLERLSAKQGYKLACIQLADNMAEGDGCEKNIKSALSIYKRYAFLGDMDCADKIVDLVYREDSISNLVAVPWMIRQVINGNLKMADELIRVFTEGLYGVSIDIEDTEKIQSIIAESGDDKYIDKLKQQAEEREDYKSVIKWSRKLRDINSDFFDETKHREYLNKFISDLDLKPVLLYCRGKQCIDAKIMDLAEAYIVASAEKGYVLAQEQLCFEYYSGSHFIKDFQKSVYWGDKALEQGSKIVRFRIAWLYCGEGDVAPDYEKSFKLYEALAQEGDTSAMNNLGWMYEYGHYHSVDFNKAYECYNEAAEKGDAYSMCNVGNCYKNGIGVEKDQVKAFEWFHKSAAQGHVRAIKQLIHCYKNGIGVEKDENKVIEYYEKIIEMGEKDEIVNFGHFYEHVVCNYDKAIYYYRMAAEQGDDVGQYNLGIMYDYGTGVEEDENTAIYWYRKAARQGNEDAQERLDELEVDWLEEN